MTYLNIKIILNFILDFQDLDFIKSLMVYIITFENSLDIH